METYSYQQMLPSCALNRSLLTELEKRLLLGIPRLLQKGLRKVLQGLGLEDHKKLESYQLVVETARQTRTLKAAEQLGATHFEPRTRTVTMVYKLGAPRIITIELTFPHNGRSQLTMTTQSQQIEQLLPKIAEGLCASIVSHGTRHKLLHNPLVQAALLLAAPALVMGYGMARGIDPFLLYASMGWLCLLTLGVVRSLPSLFPWVLFETGSRFQLSRLPLLAKSALLLVAIGCYIGLVLLNMPAGLPG